ncbi:PH domain-containing protein [Streptomyces laurentii]|uniref:hypothetical protein n=1 Tax=Streptomyces laurentii TaxID=39478 RepID=UPI003682DB96
MDDERTQSGDSMLRDSLEAHGLKMSDTGIPDEAPYILTAIRAVTGHYVRPAVSIPRTSPTALDQIDRRWHEEAEYLRIYARDGEFLLRTSDAGSEERGWLRLRDTVRTRLPSRIKSSTGYREFIAVSLDGRSLCAVSIEEDEDWIVTHVFTSEAHHTIPRRAENQ